MKIISLCFVLLVSCSEPASQVTAPTTASKQVSGGCCMSSARADSTTQNTGETGLSHQDKNPQE